MRTYWQKKIQEDVEHACDNPDWVQWSQPVFELLKEKPMSIKELRNKIREKNMSIRGGLMNALCWLDLHEKIRLERGRYVITGLYNKREEKFNLHDFLRKKAEAYNTTVEAILSKKDFGSCVQARDHACFDLRNLGITHISKLMGFSPARVQQSIERYKAGKW